MAAKRDYECRVSPAEFAASRKQTPDLCPAAYLSKTSILGSPDTSDTENRSLGQNDESQDSDGGAATDSVDRSRNEGNRYAMEPQCGVEYLRNRPPKRLMDTIVNDLDIRAKSIAEQLKRQQVWNKDIQRGIDVIADDLQRLPALEETIIAIETKLDMLIGSGGYERSDLLAK